jgi:hypothetical protein
MRIRECAFVTNRFDMNNVSDNFHIWSSGLRLTVQAFNPSPRL